MTDDDRLAELLLEWEERFERGDDVPPAALCPDRPDLAARLADRIARLRRSAWLAAPPPAAPPAGPLAGRYRLDELVGEGGYGQVWRGFDLDLRRPVAVKVPRPDRRRPPDGFLDEARKAAGVAAPGVVPVYDIGRHGDGYFIVSELVAGPDLGRRAAASPLGARDAVRVGAEVAEALDHAHRRGLLHLDVKPANVLLDPAGRALLTDFGISARAGDPPPAAGGGTPGYMAPEQRPGGSGVLDGRADVYAVGVLVRELVTHGRGGAAGLAACRAVPRSVLPVLRRCLADSPEDRYPTAAALAADLRAAAARLLTAAEWAGCSDPDRMVAHVNEYPWDERKVRLAACACVRAAWPGGLGRAAGRAVEAAEGYADGRLTKAELDAANDAAWEAVRFEPSPEATAAWATDYSLWGAVRETGRRLAPAAQCEVWRDLFGPALFRPVDAARWRSPAAAALAGEIDRTGDRGRLPELAALLEAAGCDDPDVLGHCRSGGPHYRGCWVVDLVGRGAAVGAGLSPPAPSPVDS